MFGTVYRAKRLSTDDQLHVQVAIKLVAIESTHKIINVTKFLQVVPQAKALLKLKHQHIVAYVDSFEYTVPSHSKGIAIVFEYCLKGSLQPYLSHDMRHRNITLRYKWYAQLASACSFMHAKNVIHYDLEPANILVNSCSNLKICDVGVAKIAWDVWTAHDSQDTMTFHQYMTSAACTKYYMAPEVWSGHYTSKCDVFSLGLVYIKIAESQSIIGAPSTGQDSPLGVALSKKVKNPCSTIACAFKRAENPEVRLCNKMLQYDPNNRPSMSEVEREVKTMLSNASKLNDSTKQFSTSVESIIEIFEQDAFVNAVYAFDQAANAILYTQRENFKRIKVNQSPELSEAIDNADNTFCKVSDSLLLLNMGLIPGGGSTNCNMDEVIKSCKLNTPDFETMDALFDANKLDTRFQELKKDCKKAEDLSTSAADVCEKMARSRFGERIRILSCLFLLLSLATLVPMACILSVLEPLLQATISIEILQSTSALILTMTALVVGVLLTYIYYLSHMDYEKATRELKNCAESLGLLGNSLPELHEAVLNKYNEIEQAKRSIEALQPHCDDYRHYISSAIASPLSRLRHKYRT